MTPTVALVSEHSSLRAAITGGTPVPSVYACYRFATKLRTSGDMLAACIDRVTASLRAQVPELGRNIAIDGSDIPAYANGQRFVSKNGPERDRFSDPDASWAHRSAVSTRKGGGFYDLKIDMAVCTATDLPLAWNVRRARDHEAIHALPLIDAARARGFAVEPATLDKGYDVGSIYDGCEAREMRPNHPPPPDARRQARGSQAPDVRPRRVAIRRSGRQTQGSEVALSDRRVQARIGWIKADRLHPLIPRETPRFCALYRRRAAVEREFGRLKNEWVLAPLRVRGLDRVRLHADLTILATLARTLARARVVPLPA